MLYHCWALLLSLWLYYYWGAKKIRVKKNKIVTHTGVESVILKSSSSFNGSVGMGTVGSVVVTVRHYTMVTFFFFV